METPGVVVTGICALAQIGLAWPVARAWRRGRRYAGLAALALLTAGLALLAAVIAQLSGASHDATGRFLIGMSVGLAVGLTLSAVVLLLTALKVRRQAEAA